MPLSEPGGFFLQRATNQIIGNTSGEDIVAGVGNDVFFVGQGAGDFNIADDVIGIGTGAAGGPSVGVGNEAPNVVVIGNDIYPTGMLSSMDGSVIIGHRLMNLAPRNANVEQMVVIGSGFEFDTGTFQRNCVLIGVGVGVRMTGAGNLQQATIIGAEAGRNPGASMSNSTFMGYRAGRGSAAATSSSGNTGFGDRVLENATNPGNTVVMGREAMGDGSVSANINIAIGLEAGQDITSGFSNIIIGSSTVAIGMTTQDGMVILGNQPAPGGGEAHLLLGNSIDKSGALTLNGHIFIGNSAGANGGLIAGIAYFVLEGGNSTSGTPDHKFPFLLGDLDSANLMLGMHRNAVSFDREDGALGDGSCTWILQDAEAGGGGGGVIGVNLPNAVAIYYDGSIGANVGELRCRFSNGTIATIAAS